jgi:L-aspartate oxidase
MTAPHVVVVGSGIAGLTAALHAAAGGCRVTVVTKDALESANTRFAQGGIAAVVFDDDRIEDHVADTLTAGAGLCDPAAVRVLAGDGPERIRELVEAGVAFDRAADGEWVRGLEAAHSYPRILHAGGDATGAAIERALVASLRGSGAAVREHAFLLDLVRTDGRVCGVDVREAGVRRRIEADAVVLATGGVGQLYAHTTNPSVATGDGIAAAARAGARIADMEFIQFHPTVLPGGPGTGGAFLVSEAVRGEGAVLRDGSGRRFAFDAHPDGELAPRDVVARAIWRRMAEQDGRPVMLDATRLRDTPAETAAFLARRFPTIDAAVRACGWDWAREPVPVTPAAHYAMGGIVADLDGRTSIPGLYAVGEVARTGVHGANRLASNSLLEGAVFGARAGDAVAADIRRAVRPVLPRLPEPAAAGDQSAPAPDAGPFSRAALQELMWSHAGLLRSGDGLADAAGILAAWTAQRRTPRTRAEHEDENLLQCATLVVDAARARTTSVGAHFRTDTATLVDTVPEEALAC